MGVLGQCIIILNPAVTRTPAFIYDVTMPEGVSFGVRPGDVGLGQGVTLPG